MKEKNTAQLWDVVWERPSNIEKDLFRVAKEQALIRWQRMDAKVVSRFGGFEGLSVIELGAGRGTNAALMAQRGAKVSVLDYSESALERSRALFRRLNVPVEFILQDALALPESMHGRFDISMSFGLAEHFFGEQRAMILKAHFDLLNAGGLTFISVPNAHNPPYRMYKWITEHTGRWTIGEEYPFSRGELAAYCSSFGVEEYEFFGDSLWRSKKFLNPLKWFPRREKAARTAPAANRKSVAGSATPAAAGSATPAAAGSVTPAAAESVTPAAAGSVASDATPGAKAAAVTAASKPSSKLRYRRVPRRERGTPLDARYSYALVLCAAKPQTSSNEA